MPDNHGDKPGVRPHGLNRRNMLLAGTTLVTSAIAADRSMQVAQAQTPAPMPATGGNKPNIIMIVAARQGACRRQISTAWRQKA
jgi:hypothetical protein